MQRCIVCRRISTKFVESDKAAGLSRSGLMAFTGHERPFEAACQVRGCRDFAISLAEGG